MRGTTDLTTVSPQTSVETTETALFESSGSDVVRNKNDQKQTEIVIKNIKNLLVRMRSAVQIWSAAPKRYNPNLLPIGHGFGFVVSVIGTKNDKFYGSP